MTQRTSIDDIHLHAKNTLQKVAYDYAAGGAGDESIFVHERKQLDRIRFISRCLTGNGAPDTSVSILGKAHRTPIIIAPTAFHEMFHSGGELETARGARQFDGGMILSTMSTSKMEDVASEAGASSWFQLYFYRDRRITEALVRRAENAGFSAIVLTVDLPVLGIRCRDLKNGFSPPENILSSNLLPLNHSGKHLPLGEFVKTNFESSLCWEDVKWLINISKIPVILKGILSPLDAKLALDSGIAGIIVSNHGGRQFDALVSAIDVIEGIRAVVGPDYLLLADGGVRSGTDVMRYIAKGATAVLVGKPIIWGLASAGANGVLEVLNILETQLRNQMWILGCSSVKQLNRDFIARGIS